MLAPVRVEDDVLAGLLGNLSRNETVQDVATFQVNNLQILIRLYEGADGFQ